MTLKNYIYKAKKCILPFRSAIFAVIISVMASITVSVVSEVGKSMMTQEMDSIGLNGLTSSIYNSKGENITDENFYKSIIQINDITDAAPVMTENVSVYFSNNTSSSAVCWGITPDISDVISLQNTAGRMINSGDISSNKRVCMIDENLAQKIYKRTNICGKKLTIKFSNKEAEFTVIGTIRKNSNVMNSLTGDVIPDFIYIPYSTMMDLSSKSVFDQIIFTSDNNEYIKSELKEKLVSVNRKYSDCIINITDLSGQKEQINNIIDTAFLSLFLVSCVSVLVCSMSVASSVNTAVISKQKDIGIKISMGASYVNIIVEFMLSALSACLIGILVAAFMTAILLSAVSAVFDINIVIDNTLIAISIFATIGLTTIFSFAPSCKAAKMPPIKALNRE